jgi:2-polyprenyl-6-methoxyphenol hydroxylase-like FAD-dependent oxidoreductase
MYTLKTVLADALYTERSVLIGNAANTLHPVGAQGFNLGLRDAIMLAKKILAYAGKDIGEKSLLRSYADHRLADQKRVVSQFTRYLIYPSILQWLGILSAEYIPGFKKHLGNIGLGRVSHV